MRVTAKKITRYRTEEGVWAAFAEDRPAMVGFIFSAISMSLANKISVQKAEEDGSGSNPRMSDFGKFIEGCAAALELEPNKFSEMMKDEQRGLQAEAVMGDPLAEGLLRYFSREDAAPLTVSASELLRKLEHHTDRRDWPKVNRVRGRLSQLALGLRAHGIDITFTPPHGKKNVWIMDITTNTDFDPDVIPPGWPRIC